MAMQGRFDGLLRNISLPATQEQRMDSARTALAGYLVQAYALDPALVFLQGSYANGTAIRPPTGGEYDVDIVCVCVPVSGATSQDALNGLKSVLSRSGNYAHRIIVKNTCVRLEFAEDEVGKFHVDVVPVRPSLTDAPLDAPHLKRDWHATAPAEYTTWCHAQGELYMSTVRMLKHWRNEQQPVRTAIKSIVLQVLVQSCMPQIADHAARVAATFNNLANYLRDLDSPPEVWNPVLRSENLAAHWPSEAFRNFKAEVDEAREISALAQTQVSEAQAAELWSMLFGEAFPASTKDDYGLRLADYSHAQHESSRGWVQALDSRYGVSVTARTYRGYGSQNSRHYTDDGSPIFAGRKIKFTAMPHGPGPYEVWWQVANTGGHARSIQGGLRGDFFKGKAPSGKPSKDQNINWESTSYTGVHLIRPVLVATGKVVAKAPWMRVNVIDPARPFTY